ncbi:SIS domain-containing protein [Thiomonas sp. FB-6]|uniref:SIS domain-containing protein n=1 Tax=Thiomonas sp. FB-6 TaxID=1158291 RepID=UPI00036B9B06|nr:SIS domain-containing protein [Thiomonas sp. FB-6]
MLERIRDQYEQLSAAERKVADELLQHPNDFVRAAVADIARIAGVSQPTVIRFARSVGCTGLQELKLKLAGSLVSGVPYVHADVTAGDSIAEVSAKIFDNVISALIKCRNEVSPQSIEDAVDLIAQTRRLEFYGLGNSGIIAADAQHKFFRFDIPTVAYSDPHVQSMAAALLGPRDVLVAISNSGRTNELLDAADIALGNGCRVIALTSPGSPLARMATVPIYANAREDAEIYSPMISRILHLTLIDVLAVGVALKRGPAVIQPLERTKQSLRTRKRVAEDPS